MSADDTVSVVVVTYQSAPTLGRCLAALRGQTLSPLEVILSDNASADGAAQAAVAADPSLVLMAHASNLGFAAANNRAAARAQGRWLVLLNPDAYPEPQWLDRLIAAAAAHPDIRCFAARQLMAGDPSRLDGRGDAVTPFGFNFRTDFGRPAGASAGVAEVFAACGAAMMIDRALFLDLGGFDETFFCYCEDADLGYRLRLAGEPVGLADDAVVLHEGSVSTGGRRSDFSVYHGVRNRLWMFVKDTPPLLFWLALPAHLALTAVLWARAGVSGCGGAFTRALADGLKGLPTVWRRRRAVQAARKATVLDIARMMTWSPLDIARRAGRVAPRS